MPLNDFVAPISAGISSIVNYVMNKQNNALQTQLHYDDQAWQQQMAQQANQWSIEQWMRENEYNDPKNQMARLQEAGINPALAYASGVFNQAATSPNVQMPSNGQAAHTLPFHLDPMMYSNLETQKAQRDLLEAQEEAVKHDTVRKDKMLTYSINLNEAQVKHLDSLSEYLGELKSFTHENKELTVILGKIKEKEFNILQETLMSQISSIRSRARIDYATAERIGDLLKNQIELLKQSAYSAQQRGDLSKEQKEYFGSLVTYYDNALTGLTNSQKSYYDALSGYTGEKNDYLPIEIIFEGVNAASNAVRSGAELASQIMQGKKLPQSVFQYPSSSTSSSQFHF